MDKKKGRLYMGKRETLQRKCSVCLFVTFIRYNF